MISRNPGTIGLAILGSGGIAAAHGGAFSRVPGVTIRSVYGSDVTRARRLADKLPDAQPSTDLEAVLADPRIEAVVVCGRTSSHLYRAHAALSAGKHVLIEKPPTFKLEDFDGLLDLAREVDRHLMVAQTVRFQPAMATMGRAVSAGEIGQPRLIHASWYVGHVWPGAWKSWQLDPLQSGGHGIHNGMHPLDLAIWLLGSRPIRIMARGWNTHAPDMPTPDNFHFTVAFEDGGLALLETAYSLRPQGTVLRRLLLAGSEGTLEHHTSRDPRAPGVPGSPASVDDGGFYQATHFIEVVRGQVAPLISPAQSRQALAAAIAAQESLDHGYAVSIEEEMDE